MHAEITWTPPAHQYGLEETNTPEDLKNARKSLLGFTFLSKDMFCTWSARPAVDVGIIRPPVAFESKQMTLLIDTLRR